MVSNAERVRLRLTRTWTRARAQAFCGQSRIPAGCKVSMQGSGDGVALSCCAGCRWREELRQRLAGRRVLDQCEGGRGMRMEGCASPGAGVREVERRKGNDDGEEAEGRVDQFRAGLRATRPSPKRTLALHRGCGGRDDQATASFTAPGQSSAPPSLVTVTGNAATSASSARRRLLQPAPGPPSSFFSQFAFCAPALFSACSQSVRPPGI